MPIYCMSGLASCYAASACLRRLLRRRGRFLSLRLSRFLARRLLLLLLLLFQLALLVPRSADRCRHSWFLACRKPVGVLLDAFSFRLTVDIERPSVASSCRTSDRLCTGICFRIRRVGLETVLVGKSAKCVVERIELLY